MKYRQLRTTESRLFSSLLFLQLWIAISPAACIQVHTFAFHVACLSKNNDQVVVQPARTSLGPLGSDAAASASWSFSGTRNRAQWALGATPVEAKQGDAADVAQLESEEQLKEAKTLERKKKQVGRNT